MLIFGLLGCIAPTTVGVRNDAYLGRPGAFSVGLATAGYTYDVTFEGTVAPKIALAGAFGWNSGLVHSEADVRLGGSSSFDRAGASVIAGAGVLVTGDGGWAGPYVGGVYGAPVGENIRLYAGAKVNPASGIGDPDYYLDAVFVEPAIGMSVRLGREPRATGVLGLELVGLASLYEGELGVAPLLLLYGGVGMGRPSGRIRQPTELGTSDLPDVPYVRATWVDVGDYAVGFGVAEVDRELWMQVTGESVGHPWDVPILGKSPEQAIAFCNALSEGMGYEPAYGPGGQRIPGANGWRLPTADEWRAGAAQQSGIMWSAANAADPQPVTEDDLPIAVVGNASEWAWDAERGWGQFGGSWQDAAVGPGVVVWDATPSATVGFRVVRTLEK